MTAVILTFGVSLLMSLGLPPHEGAGPDCGGTTARGLTFETSLVHSSFALSSDGDRILFTEDGKLRAVSLHDGTVLTIRRLPVGTPNSSNPSVTAVPRRPGTFILSKQRGDSHSAFDIWLEPLSGSRRIDVDVGEDGSDGDVRVADSGRYLSAGTGYACLGGDHGCFVRSYSVFSTETGARVFSTSLPTVSETQPDATGQGTEVRLSSQLDRASWAENDVLVLTFYDGSSRAFAADSAGSWISVSSVPVLPRRLSRQNVLGPTIDLTSTDGTSLGTVLLSCYFGLTARQVEILRNRDTVVLLNRTEKS